MTQEIRHVYDLSAAEQQHLFEWDEDVFQISVHGLEWRNQDVFICVYDHGQLVSAVGLLRHTITVDGTPLEVGGIGSVVSVPAAQGRGFARVALTEAAHMMRCAWNLDFGMLFCLEHLVPFYTRQGWQRVAAPVHIEQSTGTRVSPMPAMVLPLRQQPWPVGPVILHSLPW